MVKSIFCDKSKLAELLASHEEQVLRLTQFVKKGDEVESGCDPVWIEPLQDECFELLLGDEVVTSQIIDGVTVRFCEEVAYFEVRQDDVVDLSSVAEMAYQKVFRLMEQLPDYQLLRIWNYVPRILEGADEQERYRLFNAGRFAAWQERGPKDEAGAPVYPAATGIGAYAGPLVVQVLLTRQSVRHVQNYRQVPAATYSGKFGKLPPVFARGSLCSGQLIISGTASVLGEETVHETAKEQAEETLRNLKALCSLKNLGACSFEIADLHTIRVYVRKGEDLAEIKQVLVGLDHPIYLRDEICRPGLLLEIEGIMG